MFINIVLDSKLDLFKVYSLNSKDRELVNKKFDDLHREDKMKWITRATQYEYSMFVI